MPQHLCRLVPGHRRKLRVHIPDVSHRVREHDRHGRLLHGQRKHAQLLGAPPAVTPQCRLPQLPRDRRPQSRQPVFRQVIVCSGTHRLDRHLLVDIARHQQKRNIQLAALEDLQRLHSGESWHRVIRDDQVPSPLRQLCTHRRRIRHAFPIRAVSGRRQLVHQQLRIRGCIVHDEYRQRAWRTDNRGWSTHGWRGNG